MISKRAKISATAQIGNGTRIGDNAEIGDGAIIGCECIIHVNVCIDSGVLLGDRCKIQRNASIFRGAVLEYGVFIGPSVIILNDKYPRAINPNGSPKTSGDWQVRGVTLKYGAAIGGGATVCPGVTIGQWAMIGAGSVVTCDIPDYALAYGNPARCVGLVDAAGARLLDQ
jgi:UDP-2-acetamido-3-amino-2,3-dideoxy-glucuronate N-acetyltransferase